MTDRTANAVLRRLLRTRVGRRLGRRLAVVRYAGRRTGRPHEAVVRYVRSGPTVWVLVGETDIWWHNVRAPAEVDLWLAGRRIHASAVAVVGAQQPAEARRGLLAYRRQTATVGGRPVTGSDAPAQDAPTAVLVRADLRSDPDEAA